MLNLLVTSWPLPVDALCIAKVKFEDPVLSSAETVTTVSPIAVDSANCPLVSIWILSGLAAFEVASNWSSRSWTKPQVPLS